MCHTYTHTHTKKSEFIYVSLRLLLSVPQSTLEAVAVTCHAWGILLIGSQATKLEQCERALIQALQSRIHKRWCQMMYKSWSLSECADRGKLRTWGHNKAKLGKITNVLDIGKNAPQTSQTAKLRLSLLVAPVLPVQTRKLQDIVAVAAGIAHTRSWRTALGLLVLGWPICSSPKECQTPLETLGNRLVGKEHVWGFNNLAGTGQSLEEHEHSIQPPMVFGSAQADRWRCKHGNCHPENLGRQRDSKT